MIGKRYNPRFFGEFEALAERMMSNTYCDELIAIIQKFMSNPLLYNDCMTTYYSQHRPEELAQGLPPVTDAKLLYDAYHYAGATSNRTEAGTLATKVVSYFIDKAPKGEFAIPLKLAEIYYLLNFAASSREKFLRFKEKTVTMDEVKVELKKQQQLPTADLAEILPGSAVTDEQRELAIDSYTETAKNTVPNLIADLELLLHQSYGNAGAEKRKAIEDLLEDLAAANKKYKSELEVIDAFQSFFKM